MSGPPLRERPASITFLCLVFFVGRLPSLLLIFTSAIIPTVSWYRPYMVGSHCAMLGCAIGLWKMKRWAALAFAPLVATNQLVSLQAGMWSLVSLIASGVFVFVVLSNLSKTS